jgi:hypothetical protein
VRLLIAWQQSLPPPGHESDEERELKMNWERVYERWERKVKTEVKAKVKAEVRAEGKAEGKAEAVLVVLSGRALAITAAQRKQVLACTDGAQLDAWLRATGTTPSVKALLSGGALTPPRDKRSRPVARKSRTAKASGLRVRTPSSP